MFKKKQKCKTNKQTNKHENHPRSHLSFLFYVLKYTYLFKKNRIMFHLLFFLNIFIEV